MTSEIPSHIADCLEGPKAAVTYSHQPFFVSRTKSHDSEGNTAWKQSWSVNIIKKGISTCKCAQGRNLVWNFGSLLTCIFTLNSITLILKEVFHISCKEYLSSIGVFIENDVIVWKWGLFMHVSIYKEYGKLFGYLPANFFPPFCFHSVLFPLIYLLLQITLDWINIFRYWLTCPIVIIRH